MNICFTSHRYAPLIGGYDNQIRLLAEHLSKYHNVKVVTYNLTSSPQTENIDQVEVIRVKPQLVFFRVPLSVGYLKKIGEQNFDLLHAHGFVPLVSDLSVAYAKSKGKATVYTHHFDGNVQDAKGWNAIANVYNHTIARESLHYADSVVATTKSYAETSPVLKQCLSKVKVIPCFVDVNRFQPQPPTKVAELRRGLGLADKKVVLFVGRIVPYKGVEYLIDAAEYAKTMYGEDLTLLLLGGGEGKAITDESSYYMQIKLKAKKSSVSKNIRFIGRVENSELPVYYSLADVVALPSTMRGEAFGTVLLEALSCGTPVVASRISGVQDVLKNGTTVGCYANPKDIANLSQALIKMLPTKCTVSCECRRFVEENYHVEKVVQNYLDLYSHFGLTSK